MAKFVVESPHTEEDCVRTLDEMLEKGEDTFKKFVFGCKSGDHVGWTYLEADNKEEALNVVPESIRDVASATEVTKFTAEELKEAHSK